MSSDSMTWDRLIRRFGSASDRASPVGLAVQEHTNRATLPGLYGASLKRPAVSVLDRFQAIGAAPQVPGGD